MKKMKTAPGHRSFFCMLVMLLLLLAFCGCGQTQNGDPAVTDPAAAGTEETQPAEQTTPEAQTTAAHKPLVAIAGNDIRDFRIVIPENHTAAVYSSAMDLTKHFESLCGRAPEIVLDSEPAADGIHEIHIGTTNRGLTTSEGFYFVMTSGGNLYLGGMPEALAPDAVAYYIQNYRDFAEDDVSQVCYGEAPIALTEAGYEDYRLVWHDEFDLDKLDSTKWSRIQLSASDVVTYGKSKDFVYVANGALNLDIVSQTEIPIPVSTRDIMAYQYGYIQCSMRLPAESGAWPAFWMTSEAKKPSLNFDGSEYLAEIDVMEAFGTCRKTCVTLHKWYLDHNEHYQKVLGWYEMPDDRLSEDYHVFGFGWDAEKMWFDVDGMLVCRINYLDEDFGDQIDGMTGFQNPICVHLDLAGVVGEKYTAQWPALAEDEDFPVNYAIDWVRLYQIPGQGDVFYYD